MRQQLAEERQLHTRRQTTNPTWREDCLVQPNLEDKHLKREFTRRTWSRRTLYTRAFVGLGNFMRFRNSYHFVMAGPKSAPWKLETV
jgi:hypothetical protein